MRRTRCQSVIALLLGSAAIAPIAWGFRTGPSSGYSGGPLGGSANCTECHGMNQGTGGIELQGAPLRYRPSAIYELTIRAADPDQLGAGFEISAEGSGSHRGTFSLSDPERTQFANGFDPDYVTHNLTGVEDSIAQWSNNGGAYEYHLRWQAPAMPAGNFTFFVAGMAIDDSNTPNADHYYRTYARSRPAVAGDLDGDGDVDLFDGAASLSCHDQDVTGLADGCAHADVDGDTLVTLDDWADFAPLLAGPTSPIPAGYALADAVRGGQLYDRWWRVIGAPTPTGNHPLYPLSGVQNGSVTFRCKECHGWDYKGVDGQYGTGSHATGITGLFGTELSSRAIFELLKGDPKVVPNGHNMINLGMSEGDVWDAVRFTLEGVVDTDTYIDAGGSFTGDPDFGGFTYFGTCFSCHGEEGKDINFGTAQNPSYVGTIADENPWEFLHKVRFGDPGTPMASTALLGYSAAGDRNVGTFAQTLPNE